MIFLFRLVQVFLILTTPFFLLIRGAVFLHTRFEAHAWVSILGSTMVTAALLFLYLTFLRRRLTRRRPTPAGKKIRLLLSLVLVAGFAFQGLMYISAENVKRPSLQKEFRELHPILRLSASTIFMVDRRAIMTDAQRVPEDYDRMGLPRNAGSLHYRQQDGYVYAVDIRTNGRAEWRNNCTRIYFRFMGFNTLRHMGTGDHLHVSLVNPSKPRAR